MANPFERFALPASEFQPASAGTLQSFVENARQSFVYALYHSPYNAIAQTVNHIRGEQTLGQFEVPQQAKPYSSDWAAQQLGGGLGTMLPFLAVGMLGRLAAVRGASTSLSIGSQMTMGACYAGLLTPVEETAGRSFVEQRMTNGLIGACSFGLMAGIASGMKSYGASKLPFSSLARSEVANTLAFGLLIGSVNADVESYIRTGERASFDQRLQSMISFTLVNAAMLGGRSLMQSSISRSAPREPASGTVEREAGQRQEPLDTTVQPGGANPMASSINPRQPGRVGMNPPPLDARTRSELANHFEALARPQVLIELHDAVARECASHQEQARLAQRLKLFRSLNALERNAQTRRSEYNQRAQNGGLSETIRDEAAQRVDRYDRQLARWATERPNLERQLLQELDAFAYRVEGAMNRVLASHNLPELAIGSELRNCNHYRRARVGAQAENLLARSPRDVQELAGILTHEYLHELQDVIMFRHAIHHLRSQGIENPTVNQVLAEYNSVARANWLMDLPYGMSRSFGGEVQFLQNLIAAETRPGVTFRSEDAQLARQLGQNTGYPRADRSLAPDVRRLNWVLDQLEGPRPDGAYNQLEGLFRRMAIPDDRLNIFHRNTGGSALTAEIAHKHAPASVRDAWHNWRQVADNPRALARMGPRLEQAQADLGRHLGQRVSQLQSAVTRGNRGYYGSIFERQAFGIKHLMDEALASRSAW